jgi:hypothetical protein
MIIWLASFPRSGNTLLRQILKQVFKQETYSDSNDPNDLGIHQAGKKFAGHQNYIGKWSDFYESAKNSETINFIKTHQPPRDTGKAIYVVRDGRAAIISYFHFIREFRGDTNKTLSDVILGKTALGSWSAHLEKWQPLERKNTLLVRFEDLSQSVEKCISEIAQFTGLNPQGPWMNPLSRFREAMPGFVRQGCNQTNIAELDGEEKQLFWDQHSGWIKKLGYA